MGLHEHKIAQITNVCVRNRYPRLYGKNARLPEHAYGHDIHIVEVETDQGAKGWGMGHCDAAKKELIIGKTVNEIFAPDKGVTADFAMPIDIALHDLAGNILNIPVFKMINSSSDLKNVSVDCYDGAIYMNDISPDLRPGGINAVINDCRYDKEILGYNAFKVKIGRGNKWMTYEEGFERDVDIIRKIKAEFPDCGIMVDANDGYDLKTTKRFIDAVSDCDIYWLEEPFVENVNDFYELREYLQKKSPGTLIADGESNWNIDLLTELAEKKIIDVLLMDTVGYGFTKWREFMSKVKDLNVMASPHCWGEKLKTHYAAHLSAAYGSIIPTIEGVPDETEGVIFDGYKIKNGTITVPQKQGFGMDLYWARKIT